MIRVCPLSAFPPGEALRVEAEPPIAVIHTESGEIFAIDDSHVDAPPAQKPVRTHAVVVQDDHIHVELSDEAPNLPPGVLSGATS